MTGQDGNGRPGWYTTPTPCRTPTGNTKNKTCPQWEVLIKRAGLLKTWLEHENITKTSIWFHFLKALKRIYEPCPRCNPALERWSGFGGCVCEHTPAKTVNSISRSPGRRAPEREHKPRRTQADCLTLEIYFPLRERHRESQTRFSSNQRLISIFYEKEENNTKGDLKCQKRWAVYLWCEISERFPPFLVAIVLFYLTGLFFRTWRMLFFNSNKEQPDRNLPLPDMFFYMS